MKEKQVNPVVFVVLIVLALAGLGFFSWRALTGPSNAPEVVVKPANPNDPKYQPDPRLGLGGGGNPGGPSTP